MVTSVYRLFFKVRYIATKMCFGIEEEYLEVDRHKSIQASIKIFKVQTIREAV